MLTRGNMLEHLAQRSRDEDFRRALIADPRGVLSSEFAIPIPKAIRVVVVEEEPDTCTLILPYLSQDGAELDDSELELVAGGKPGGPIDF